MNASSISAMKITFLIATFTALIVLCSSAVQIDLTPEVDKLSSLSGTKRSSNSGDLESAASDRLFFGYGGGVPYGISTTYRGNLSPGYKGYYPGIIGSGNTGYGYYGTGGYGGYGNSYGGYGSGYGGYGTGYSNSIGYGSGYSGYGNGYGGYGGYVSGIGSYGGLDDSYGYGNRGYGSRGYGGYGIYDSLGGYGGLYGNRGSYYGSPSGYRGYSK